MRFRPHSVTKHVFFVFKQMNHNSLALCSDLIKFRNSSKSVVTDGTITFNKVERIFKKTA